MGHNRPHVVGFPIRREFAVIDPDGNLLRIGQVLDE